jgi:hypothetical protein
MMMWGICVTGVEEPEHLVQPKTVFRREVTLSGGLISKLLGGRLPGNAPLSGGLASKL